MRGERNRNYQVEGNDVELLPVFYNIREKHCLVVGGGEVASRRVRLLLQAGGKVHIVAPRLAEDLVHLLSRGEITHQAAEYSSSDLETVVLVIAATNNAQVNQQIAADAKRQNIPVNVVDAPHLSSFIIPSIIDRSPVTIAISSGGASPVLSRLLKARLEALVPASYGRLALLVQGFRDTVKQRFADGRQRRLFWEKILQGPVAEMMFSGQETAARQTLAQAIADGTQQLEKRGEVYLVGAGPGDPDLLTFRALRLLQQADVIVYDRLVAPPILDMARKDAQRIYVGKKKSDHALPQDQINQLLVQLAKEGKKVVRLKGGDPFVFGRGGEEIETLMQQGILFQVVPGITAASGCAAYAGIPLTHRDYAQSVVFATGHLKDDSIDLDWDALIQKRQTIVFYMGLTGLKIICEQLIRHGMSPAMPVALVQKGTTPRQKVFTGTLQTMPAIFDANEIKPPTLIIVGEVVKLREKLAWFEKATMQ